MALFDFGSQPVGGYAQGPSPNPGDYPAPYSGPWRYPSEDEFKGIPASNISWNQLISLLAGGDIKNTNTFGVQRGNVGYPPQLSTIGVPEQPQQNSDIGDIVSLIQLASLI